MMLLEISIPVRDYDLAATLTSGQAFRWRKVGGSWEGVIGTYWVRLTHRADSVLAQAAETVTDWGWLTHYLQTDVDLKPILLTFPEDAAMRASIAACRG